MSYVYLDWNVIQYMKHQTKTNSIDGKAFYDLVKKLSKKYKFPFSEGHLRDLAISFTPENKEIKNDLKYLKDLSSGHALDKDLNLVTVDYADMHKIFNEIVVQIESEPNFEVHGKNFIVDTEKLPKKDLFITLLESNNSVFDVALMKNFLSEIWIKMDSPEFYKSFRTQVVELKNRFNTTNTILDQQSDYFKSIIPFLDFLVTDDLQILKNNFNEAMNAFAAINGRCFDSFSQGSKIEQAYSLLDFNPLFGERINKKNKPSNMLRDTKNLFLHHKRNTTLQKMIQILEKHLL